MEHISENLPSVLEKYLKTAPVSDICPLADETIRPDWKCGKFHRGGESFCKSVAGYSKCPHYVKWFYWNLYRMVAKELAKIEVEQKKKVSPKRNLK